MLNWANMLDWARQYTYLASAVALMAAPAAATGAIWPLIAGWCMGAEWIDAPHRAGRPATEEVNA